MHQLYFCIWQQSFELCDTRWYFCCKVLIVVCVSGHVSRSFLSNKERLIRHRWRWHTVSSTCAILGKVMSWSYEVRASGQNCRMATQYSFFLICKSTFWLIVLIKSGFNGVNNTDDSSFSDLYDRLSQSYRRNSFFFFFFCSLSAPLLRSAPAGLQMWRRSC